MSDTSEGFEAVQDNAAVGLSDPTFSSSRRQMLDLINRLHGTGVQADMDLPMIAVIGSQSAGKSSLIESISGITLPRASGTCTRCPTECRLSSSTDAWKCLVSLRFTCDARGHPLGQAVNEPFGEPILNKNDVEDRIRRAQRAILNPSTPAVHFLTGDLDDGSVTEVAFSSNCISLQISGNNVADLSFVDLPGMIATGPDKDIIENLVVSYIQKPSCIILLTVACETDWENQRGFDLAQRYDPDGKRTIGVLTKPDRIGRGDHEHWIQFIKNEKTPLENGWFSVKQPDTQAVKDGITWEEARDSEEQFFTITTPWSSLDASLREHLGTTNLTARLSVILSALIAKRLPELQEELQRLIQQTDDSIHRLPKPPSSDPSGEILHMISTFVQSVSAHVVGTPDEQGLLQAIGPARVEFKKAIRATAPDFRTTRDLTLLAMVPPSFLANEDDPNVSIVATGKPIYIEDVMRRANRARTRELPDYHPFDVPNEYVLSIVEQWEAPSRALFDFIEHTLLSHLRKIVNERFGRYTQGNLQHQVLAIVTEHLKECGQKALAQILWLHETEKQPQTLNDHYYSDYKANFLALYRGDRQADKHGQLVSKLKQHGTSSTFTSQLYGYGTKTKQVSQPIACTFDESTTKVLTGFSEMGVDGVKPTDLLKILPPDPLEPALNIMATVRAYFQVAYKRFVDNVPMAIDYELILGINRNGRLEKVLYSKLGVTGAGSMERCREYLADPPHIVARRKDLEKRKERLECAKRELMDLWL